MKRIRDERTAQWLGELSLISRVSGWLLSDFPGMTSLSGGVHACEGEQCSVQVLTRGQALDEAASSLRSP